MYKISDALQSFGPQQLHQGHGAFLLRCLASTKTGGKSARKKHNAQSINSIFTSMCVCVGFEDIGKQTLKMDLHGWYGLFSCIPPNVWNIQQQLHSGTPSKASSASLPKSRSKGQSPEQRTAPGGWMAGFLLLMVQKSQGQPPFGWCWNPNK